MTGVRPVKIEANQPYFYKEIKLDWQVVQVTKPADLNGQWRTNHFKQ